MPECNQRTVLTGLNTHDARGAEAGNGRAVQLLLNGVFQDAGNSDMTEGVGSPIPGMQAGFSKMSAVGNMNMPDSHGVRLDRSPDAQAIQNLDGTPRQGQRPVTGG